MPERVTHRYNAFGLNIASDFPLEELRLGDDSVPADLTIIDRDIGIDLPSEEDGVVMNYSDPDGAVMAWPGVAAFRFVDLNTIWARKYDEAPDKYFAFPLLGPVMAWYLNMRGLFVLHSSAVHFEGRTLAFLGDKLAGKSTTAAAFVRAGASLVTDDLLAIKLTKGEAPICLPAFPQLKLEDIAAETLQVAGTTPRPLVMEGFPKRQHTLDTMTTQAVPITCLVRLERGGDRPVFEPSAGAEAAGALNRFSYLPRFHDAPWSKEDHARHFANCVGLAQQSQVGTLRVPDDLGALDDAVALMHKTLREIAP